MIEFLQINLNRSGVARNLMYATAAERNTQVLMFSEPPRLPPDNDRTVTCEDNSCGIALTRTADILPLQKGSSPGYVWIRTKTMVLYSCYFAPGRTLAEFRGQIFSLERSIRLMPPDLDIVIGGDFNAKSYQWGSANEDERGYILAETMSGLGLTTLNVGSRPTFQRANSESVIDATFGRLGVSTVIQNWQVLDDYTGSDHKYIAFKMTDTSRIVEARTPVTGWAWRKLDKEALVNFLRTESLTRPDPNATAEQAAVSMTEYLTAACNSCMPPRSASGSRSKPVYWWSEDIAALRRSCFAAKRAYQRAARRRERERSESLKTEYRQSRKQLTAAIRSAQRSCWEEICDAVESDPWGLPYRIVTKKIATHPPGLEAKGREAQIANHLFPASPLVNWEEIPINPECRQVGASAQADAMFFTAEELSVAAERLPSGKACGPDGIPNEVLRLVAHHKPQSLLDVYNACLRQAHFPAVWKRARLVLLHKGPGKPIEDPSSFRPLSMLNTAGKLLERLILGRLNAHLDTAIAGRAENQFGFRTGMSTENAIRSILEAAERAARGAVQNRDLCAMVSLDVRNAFNTAPWPKIDLALQKKQVPGYIIKIIRSYLSDRTLLVVKDNVKRITCGVPQGSVIGPALWNAFYDGLLNIPMPEKTQLVAYADDVAVVSIAHTGALLEQCVNPALELVSRWMTANGLEVAPQKSEAILITKKWRYDPPVISINGHNIPVRKSLRYLGIEIDQRLSFNSHVEKIAKGAAETARAIGRLMPNLKGPSNSKRILLSTVVQSKLLYASNVWAEKGLITAKNRSAMTRAQRLIALRVIRSYRTVSAEAALMLAKILPCDLVAKERKEIRRRIQEDNETKSRIKKEERDQSLALWQVRWDSSGKGVWTRRLLPNLKRWYSAKAVLTFQATEALTGHGSFRQYLYKMNRATTPVCQYCAYPSDTAEHTIFDCPRWDSERLPVGQFLGGRSPTPEDAQDLLCGPDTQGADPEQNRFLTAAASRATSAFLDMIQGIMSKKEADERLLEEVMAMNHGG